MEVVHSSEPILEEFMVPYYHDGISCSELEESENALDEDEEPFF